MYVLAFGPLPSASQNNDASTGLVPGLKLTNMRVRTFWNFFPSNSGRAEIARAIDWLYVVNMEISKVKTKVGCYGNQILALQPCGGNPYGV